MAIDSGIVPVNELLLTSSLDSVVILPSEAGIVPLRLLSSMAKVSRYESAPSSVGISPSNLLKPSSRTELISSRVHESINTLIPHNSDPVGRRRNDFPYQTHDI